MWSRLSLILLNILLLLLHPFYLRTWLVVYLYIPVLYMHRVCCFFISLLSALFLDLYCNDMSLTNVAMVLAIYLATSENQFLLLKRSRFRRIFFPVFVMSVVYLLYILVGVYDTCMLTYIFSHMTAVCIIVSIYIFMHERLHA